MKRAYKTVAFAAGVCLIGASSVLAGQAGASGIVSSIDKAPVIADGDVAGMRTDFVITLTGSQDPNVPGRSLAAGDTIKVILPREFDLNNLEAAATAAVGRTA